MCLLNQPQPHSVGKNFIGHLLLPTSTLNGAREALRRRWTYRSVPWCDSNNSSPFSASVDHRHVQCFLLSTTTSALRRGRPHRRRHPRVQDLARVSLGCVMRVCQLVASVCSCSAPHHPHSRSYLPSQMYYALLVIYFLYQEKRVRYMDTITTWRHRRSVSCIK